MKICDVTWVQDRPGNAALDLEIDGRRADIRSSQRSKLTDCGSVVGISYLRSELADASRNTFVQGTCGPEINDAELVGCTDNPTVFALFTEMCDAIRAGTWTPGPRALKG